MIGEPLQELEVPAGQPGLDCQYMVSCCHKPLQGERRMTPKGLSEQRTSRCQRPHAAEARWQRARPGHRPNTGAKPGTHTGARPGNPPAADSARDAAGG
ncbi:hypothetical protein GCM10010123_17300 [Pilimelia anulata]|uniref:Uncharacterized protein n=1 Tax=Pilimelia anulata TaxID=53371 RepID=A0A8J3F9N9_9ACTN|nr:hypothetical protein GCM10010123_17300 [Pilimelia anulata]